MAAAAAAAGETPPPPANYFFGRPWPDLNAGLSYTDTFRGADAETTTTLIDFYSENYKSSAPLPGWIHRIRNGQITVDGQVVTDPDIILSEGSKLVYHRLSWKEPFAPYLLQVLYEDDDMLALNKPSGLQVLPKGLFQQRTVLAQLQWKEWKMPPSSCSKKKNVQLHPVPVHRLGRGTSGLLLCAKTKLAKVQLASYFAEGAANAEKKRDGTEVGKEWKISKFYRALVTGILEHDEDVITQPIGLVHYPGVAEGLYVACSSGKPAMSKVCVLERLAHQNQTLVQVEIHSGRPHQIRIHLAYIGHPLVDDPLYGIGGQPKFHDLEPTSTDISFAYDGGYERPLQPVPGDCGYHLHAHWLVLCHPTTNKMLKITAHLPRILQTQEERCDQQLDT
ncbi:RNA pseudouridine synthase 5 [Hordeum vulgare subsp. vulgare]|uniref:Pseudouridine synthase RsuA/RluA-like domain-containing protein n=1 Tax=Hordeum vulgare subsp. vulgare TaxID=112509 RepID=A0A8I7BCI9_HORVV|nr:RNA pseudouridine synthase 5 [Hordeum vulgare subsp. vulgare]